MKGVIWSMIFQRFRKSIDTGQRKMCSGFRLSNEVCEGLLGQEQKSDLSLERRHSLILSCWLNEHHSLIHSFSEDSHKYSLGIYHLPSFEDTAVKKILDLVLMEILISVNLTLLWFHWAFLHSRSIQKLWFLTFEKKAIPLHLKAKSTLLKSWTYTKSWQFFDFIEMIWIILMNEINS